MTTALLILALIAVIVVMVAFFASLTPQAGWVVVLFTDLPNFFAALIVCIIDAIGNANRGGD